MEDARRAEAALRESEARFRGFAETSPDVLWIIDASGQKLEYLSPAYEQVWGEPREALARDLGEWAKRLQRYYERVEALFWPDLIVVGGGVSKDSEKFLPKLKLKTPIVPAKLLNTAGIVGAARLAADRQAHPEPKLD